MVNQHWLTTGGSELETEWNRNIHAMTRRISTES
jgi:hypothetical protein